MRNLFVVLFFLTSPVLAAPVTVHVTVALCDNASQGIVPVPAAIGNGDDPSGSRPSGVGVEDCGVSACNVFLRLQRRRERL